MSPPRRIDFLTYFREEGNAAPSGGEIYHARVFAALRSHPQVRWRQCSHDMLPAPFRSKWLGHLYYLGRFLFAPPDMAIIDAGYLGRCALALPALRLRGKTAVLVVHHLNFHLKKNPLARWYDFLSTYLGFLASHKAILNSEFTEREIRRYFGYRKPTLLLHPSLSFAWRAGGGAAPRGKTLRCLYVGSLEPRKNLEVLVELARRAPAGLDFEITLVGKDVLHPDYGRRLREAEGTQGRLRFLGYLAAGDLERLYRESALFLFPSKWEGFGMAVLEALAHGLPVLAFDVSALPDLVQSGSNGILVRPYDTDGFVSQAMRLLADRDALAGLAANCRLPERFQGDWEEKSRRALDFLLG